MSANDVPSGADPLVFVVCAADAIAPGAAKAFSLSRIDEDGEGRPFPIFVARTVADAYHGFVNVCPHEKVWLNFGTGDFFSPDGAFLQCGRHGSKFVIDSGLCVEGPCESMNLEPVPLVVLDGDVCLCGIALAEADDFSDPFDDCDDTMEIMIHPD